MSVLAHAVLFELKVVISPELQTNTNVLHSGHHQEEATLD